MGEGGDIPPLLLRKLQAFCNLPACSRAASRPHHRSAGACPTPVDLGDRLVMLAKSMSRNRRRFVSRCQGFVRGNLTFEVTVTGMQV